MTPDILLSKLKKVSHLFIFLFFCLMGYLHLSTLFLTILFSYFILDHLRIFKWNWIKITVFFILMSAILYGFFFFGSQALRLFPSILASSIPTVKAIANNYGIKLPFEDLRGFKELALNGIGGKLSDIANSAANATRKVIYILIGIVAAVTIFLNKKWDLAEDTGSTFYSELCQETSKNIGVFYTSFSTVLSAQLIISSINTILTGIFVVLIDLPYAFLVIVSVFVFGLLPIIGNLISSILIIFIAITISLKMAILSLIFLIVLHKLEYFLNSKIIGSKIKNPMWLTLLGLLIGEKILGIAGLILAPVVLHYIKTEWSQIKIKEPH